MTRINLFAVPLTLCAALVLVLTTSSPAAAQRESVLYSFQGTGDGNDPWFGLVSDSKGNLYGTTFYGGAGSTCQSYSCPVAFKLSPPAAPGGAWTESVIFTFTENAGVPSALVFDKKGNLYGTAGGGTGTCACGFVFELSPGASGAPWTETILYSFLGGTTDGYDPAASVIFDQLGNLYGTTAGGGNCPIYNYGACGIAFELSPPQKKGQPWTEQVLHDFGNGYDGAVPMAPLLLAKSGVLYGTTDVGGPPECGYSDGDAVGCGTVFELIPPAQPGDAWTEDYVTIGPQNSHGGAFITGGVALSAKGNLYVAANIGGSGDCQDTTGFTAGCGVIYELAPPTASDTKWRSAIIYNFAGLPDGGLPVSTLLIEGGNLYGVAPGGGDEGFCRVTVDQVIANGCGTVFELTPPSGAASQWAETTLYRFPAGSNGSVPKGSLISNGIGGFYGTTAAGGTAGYGTVFEVTP